MSTLWTPGGEVPIEKNQGDGPEATPQPPAPPPMPDGAPAFEDLSPEQQTQVREAAEQMAQYQQEILAAPPERILANHAMGCYELAALHLQQDPPGLEAAKLAIDAFGSLLTSLEGRLGEDEITLKNAQSQIQMAFVQISEQTT